MGMPTALVVPTAIGTSLATIMLTTLSGRAPPRAHAKRGYVQWSWVKLICPSDGGWRIYWWRFRGAICRRTYCSDIPGLMVYVYLPGMVCNCSDVGDFCPCRLLLLPMRLPVRYLQRAFAILLVSVSVHLLLS